MRSWENTSNLRKYQIWLHYSQYYASPLRPHRSDQYTTPDSRVNEMCESPNVQQGNEYLPEKTRLTALWMAATWDPE